MGAAELSHDANQKRESGQDRPDKISRWKVRNVFSLPNDAGRHLQRNVSRSIRVRRKQKYYLSRKGQNTSKGIEPLCFTGAYVPSQQKARQPRF